MAYIPGTSIVAPGPILGPHIVQGSYNNPFEPGTLEYDGYQNAHNVSQAVQTGKNNINAAAGAAKEAIKEGADKVKDLVEDDEPSYPYDWGNSASVPSAPPQKLAYIDAPYAELYGMDVSTAYQEALANTAYQRKVKDLKAAGLNPVLGYSGSGSASFYGTPDAGVSFSGGVSYGSSGSGKTTSGLTDNQKDTLIRNLPTLIGGAVGLVKGPAAGNAITAVGNAVSNIIRYW